MSCTPGAVPADLDKLIAAVCRCGWVATTGNAEGLAVQHARKHGHAVTVTIEYHPHTPAQVDGQLAMEVP